MKGGRASFFSSSSLRLCPLSLSLSTRPDQPTNQSELPSLPFPPPATGASPAPAPSSPPRPVAGEAPRPPPPAPRNKR
ncbi:hypothetical protein ZWY2020_045080 [Hordeum vulgare]|nr:hypothetical protein ZWY2020_045080 [Hordeum vulgare]